MKNALKKNTLSAPEGSVTADGRVKVAKRSPSHLKRLIRVIICLVLSAIIFAAGAAWRHYTANDAPVDAGPEYHIDQTPYREKNRHGQQRSARQRPASPIDE